MSFFLLIELDHIGTGVLFFRRAVVLGLIPIHLSTKPETFPSLTEFESIKVPTMTEEALMDTIGQLGLNRLGGVWSVRDRYTGLAARVSSALGKAGANPMSVEICSDKFETRRSLADAGLKDVEFALAKSGDEAAHATRKLGGRSVVKLRSGTGSVGARLCASPDEARCHFEILSKNQPDLRLSGALIETAIEGLQFSVQIFDGRAIGVTRQDLGPPPALVTVGLDFPWRDDERLHGEMVRHAERGVAAVGHSRGPCSVDMKYGSRGPSIIEINPRLAGDMIAENIRLATGIDVVEATIRFACGMPYDLAPLHNRGSATRWLLRPNVPVREVIGLNRAACTPGVVEVRLFPSHYKRKGPVTDFRDRLAFVIAEAKTSAEAGAIAHIGLQQLRIKSTGPVERWRLAIRRLFSRLLRRKHKNAVGRNGLR